MTKRQSITAAVVFAIGAAVAWWRHNVRLGDWVESLGAVQRTYSQHGVDEATLLAARMSPEHTLWEVAAFTLGVLAVACVTIGLLAERKAQES